MTEVDPDTLRDSVAVIRYEDLPESATAALIVDPFARDGDLNDLLVDVPSGVAEDAGEDGWQVLFGQHLSAAAGEVQCQLPEWAPGDHAGRGRRL